MFNVQDSYRHVRLVRPDDPDYIAFMRRMADARPSRGGPRAAGEVLGGLTEMCVRHWLAGFVTLADERILAWEQRLRNGRHGAQFRELDAVWQIDAESLCLYEMKLTFPENMERGVGLRQLDIAADTLFVSKKYQYILKRLVYVAEEPLVVLDGLPALAPDDEFAELGVVWVPPAAVEAAAQELSIDLPADWLLPESREGHFYDPAREAWREFADSDPKPAASGETNEGEEDSDPDAGPVSPDNPLAEALRRALERKPE